MGELLVVIVVLLIVVIFTTPLVAGITLLRKPSKNALVWYAALMTLKPVLVALVWLVVILAQIQIPGGIIMPIVPSVAMTLIFSILCRKAFLNVETFPAARLLLGLDAVRWGISLLGLVLFSANWGEQAWVLPVFCLGIFAAGLPTIFAYSAPYLANKYVADSP